MPLSSSSSAALDTFSSFRQTRFAFSSKIHNHHPTRKSDSKTDPPSSDDPTASIENLGDDPLAASSGQFIVGVESCYRVIYRLINTIYVVEITVVDHDNLVNVFECIHIVNQAVSVVVTACRSVDVTREKVDIVLRGVSNIRIDAMLASLHGESIAKRVHSALDIEAKICGTNSWYSLEFHFVEHETGVKTFSESRFEKFFQVLQLMTKIRIF